MNKITVRSKKNLNSKGFTLIELLVVIAIIGLLATIVLVSVGGLRVKARDAKRISDLKQISLALDLYYTNTGTYPNSSNWRSECIAWGGYAANDVIPGLVPNYISRFPSDPTMNITDSTACYLYIASGNLQEYALLDHNTRESAYGSQPAFLDPTRDGGTNPCLLDGTSYWSWKISSPGGICY